MIGRDRIYFREKAKPNAYASESWRNAVTKDPAKHEIGHALVAARQTDSVPVQKITIIPRTSGALGYTMQVEDSNLYLMTKEEIEDKIATYTGGCATEKVVLRK